MSNFATLLRRCNPLFYISKQEFSMKQLKGILLAILSSATFGMIPLFALPAIEGGIGLNSVLFYRFALSSILIGPYLILKGERMRISFKEFITLFALGTMYAFTALFLTASYLHIPSGVATTIHFLYPVVVTGVMITFFKDRLSLPVAAATLTAIIGVCLLSRGEGDGIISLKGLGMVLFTVITYALYIVGINKSCVAKMDGLKMTFYVLLSSAVVFLINLGIQGEGLDPIPNLSTGIHLFLLAMIPTLISDLCLVLAIQQIGSTTTAVLGCMEPLTALVMGVAFLNESFGATQLIGVFLILIAVTTIILTQNKTIDWKKVIPAFLHHRIK